MLIHMIMGIMQISVAVLAVASAFVDGLARNNTTVFVFAIAFLAMNIYLYREKKQAGLIK